MPKRKLTVLTASNIPSGVDAVKIADGSVTNTEFQYINSLTSNAQTQITAKQATLSGAALTAVTVATNDKVLIQDTSDSDNLKTVLVSGIVSLASAAWGSITGTLSAQTDLQAALGAKQTTTLTTGNILVGVASVATSTQGLIAVTGASGASSPATGKIGEQILQTSSASAATGAMTAIVTVNLTEGVWLVHGTLCYDNNVGVTGCDANYYKKGSTSATNSLDRGTFRVATNGTISFTPQILVVASGDADKSIAIKAQAVGSASDCTGTVVGIRIA